MSSKFRVLIAGGSISGLTLALLLERVGIDFLILESHNDIAPQVGASIGLHPFGLRIYDQLECYDDIRALVDEPLGNGHFCGEDGKPLVEINYFSDHIEKRHGYPIIFVDRQMILEILYNHIKDKSKVLIEKRVSSVKLVPDGVEVTTQDGSSYKGDIVVGADGVHSKVKSEMWRLADALEPGYIPESEKTATPTTYKCVFGISTENPGLRANSSWTISRKHSSYLVITGPDTRVYWFLFVNTGKTELGNIPRYTEADKDEIVKQHWDDHITEDITFGDLYKSKLSAILTALPEYSFKKWHFRRIITIGDAAHKVHPLSGYGGNSAAETAATLTNELLAALAAHPTTPLSTPTISALFARTQRLREDRVWKLIKESNTEQRLVARETPFLAFFARHLVPHLLRESGRKNWREAAVVGVSVATLPIPVRPRYLPYDDELPAAPVLTASWLPEGVAAAVLAAVVYRLWTTLPPASSATALPLSLLFPATLIATLEAHRAGTARSLLAYPELFAALPLPVPALLAYLPAALLTTADPTYARTVGRPVPVAVAKAVLPVTIVAFAVAAWFGLQGGWAPVVIAAAVMGVVARVTAPPDPKIAELEAYGNADLAPLRRAFGGAGLVAGGLWAGSIAPAVMGAVESGAGAREVVEAVLQGWGREQAVVVAGVVWWQVWSVWALRRWGYIRTGGMVRAVGVLGVGQVVGGLGAAWAGLWWWREGVVGGLSARGIVGRRK